MNRRTSRTAPRPGDRRKAARSAEGKRSRQPGRKAQGTRIRVGDILDMRDFWGRRMPRPATPNVLRAAIEAHLAKPRNLLLESLAQSTGQPAERRAYSEFKAVHFQEGEFQYIFRVAARRSTGGRQYLAMVVAKGGQALNALARTELQHLRRLHRRRPRTVVTPLAGGALPVPGGPPVFVYFTKWLSNHHELGVDRRHRFFINEAPLHHFSAPASEHIRSSILTIALSLWDPAARCAPEPPQVGSGDFVISRPETGRPASLKLIACRHLVQRVSLEDCLRLYLGYHGRWADKVFSLVPKDPKLLFKALNDGLVVPNPGVVDWERLRAALADYAEALKDRGGTPPAFTPLPVLKKLMGSLHVYLKEVDGTAVVGAKKRT